jgi:FkbM family methyltransferase
VPGVCCWYDSRVFGKRRSVDAVDVPSRTVTDTNEHPGGLTRDHVVWAYRLLLDRDPENEDVIGPKLVGSRNTVELRHHLMTSAEFQQKNRDYAHTNDRTIVITELEGGLRLFVDLSDHVIGLNIVRGRYEEAAIHFVRRILRPGDTAVDAGAHIGFFTIWMAACVGPSGKVHAFEPVGANAELLERSIVENDFTGRIAFRRAAVGANSGTATLTFPQETLNTGGAYLLRSGAVPLPGNLTAHVPLVALDETPLTRPVRLVKMDVEGAEPQIVKGSTRLLEEDRPLILSELHPTQLQRASGMAVHEFLEQMRAMKYEARSLQDDGSVGAPLSDVPLETLVSVVFTPSPA